MAQNVVTSTIDYSPAAVRAWANRPGSSLTVGERGRIPSDVVDAFITAGSPDHLVPTVKRERTPARDHSLDTVAVILCRRMRGAVLRRAVVEVPVSAAALRAVRGARKGRPSSLSYLDAAVTAGTVSERDLILGMRTTAGGHYVADTTDDEETGGTVVIFRCVSKSDSAAAVAAHLATVLAEPVKPPVSLVKRTA